MIQVILFLALYSLVFACPPLDSPKFKKCQALGNEDPYVYPSPQSPQFRQELSSLLRSTQRTLRYKCLWPALAESESNPTDTTQVQLIYKQKYLPVENRDCGKNDPDSWNREHLWAKSRGFPKKSSLAYRDLHHIRASDRSVNTWRNNRYFVDFSVDEELLSLQNGECFTGCFRDKEYFEPPNDHKGEVARAILYMDLRYEGHPQDKTPDLILQKTYPERKSKLGKWGGLCTLLAWHRQDPPSDQERYRNQVIQAWQGNRNPFVDHPEWVDILYPSDCSN